MIADFMYVLGIIARTTQLTHMLHDVYLLRQIMFAKQEYENERLNI